MELWERRIALNIKCLENYLFRAVKYAVIDHLRTQIVKNKYIDYYRAFTDLDESGTENIIAINDLTTCMEKGLKTLPEKSQEVFRLSRLENWPVTKIATHINISEKGVEYHLTKSLKTLRVYLKDFVVLIAILISI